MKPIYRAPLVVTLATHTVHSWYDRTCLISQRASPQLISWEPINTPTWKEKVEEEEWSIGRSILWSAEILRPVPHSYLIIVKNLLDLYCFIRNAPPLTWLIFRAGTWGDHQQHTLLCAHMLPGGCCVQLWSTASWLVLIGQGQGPGLLSLVFCRLSAKNTCSGRRRRSAFYIMKEYKHVSIDKQDITGENKF